MNSHSVGMNSELRLCVIRVESHPVGRHFLGRLLWLTAWKGCSTNTIGGEPELIVRVSDSERLQGERQKEMYPPDSA